MSATTGTAPAGHRIARFTTRLHEVLDDLVDPAGRAAAWSMTIGPAPAAAGGRVPRPELLGQAFCSLLERIPPDRLPTTAGMNATIVVLLDADQLHHRLGAAHLATGQPLSSTQARLHTETNASP
jgi:hypothetical protein